MLEIVDGQSKRIDTSYVVNGLPQRTISNVSFHKVDLEFNVEGLRPQVYNATNWGISSQYIFPLSITVDNVNGSEEVYVLFQSTGGLLELKLSERIRYILSPDELGQLFFSETLNGDLPTVNGFYLSVLGACHITINMLCINDKSVSVRSYNYTPL